MQQTNGTIQIREYVATRWVGTSVNGTSADEAVQGSFMKLFKYISGKNAGNKKIAMTAPVLETIEAGQGPACTSRFNTSFFIAPDVAANAPAPNDPAVYLHDMPAMKIASITYGGFSDDADISKYGEQLANWLTAESIDFENNLSAFAGYSSPFRFLDRHNEVWIFLK